MDTQTESDAGFTAYIATGILSPKVQECLNSILEECSPFPKDEEFFEILKISQSRCNRDVANATLAKIVLYEFGKMYPSMVELGKCHKDCSKCTI